MRSLEMGAGLTRSDPGDWAGSCGMHPDQASNRDSADGRFDPRGAPAEPASGAGSRRWLAPALVGTAAALGAA
ncbi:hypothetical protein, partial [Microvirga massiliensis]|uniref:hypothetical protein n=1 Tax=Microvirga massiliensis TaxID=1033741 RepID=UPI000660D41D